MAEAVHRLVGNGTHLYRRASHLVRTPIKLTLAPDEMAYYAVAGSYSSQNLPAGGFIDAGTYQACVNIGRTMIGAYVSPTSTKQIWRSVNQGRDPGTVWYQGAYATSAASLPQTLSSCEAYLQLAAYHFSLPPALHGLPITSAKVIFTNGGGVQCYQSAAIGSANNSALKGFGEFRSWYLPFHLATSVDAYGFDDVGYDSSVDILADGGGFRGVRDLWGFNDSNRDGGIPTLTTPVRRSYEMGQYTLPTFSANGGGWIIPYIDATAGQNYAPYYYTSSVGYWGCISVWGLTVEVTVG